MHLTPKQPNETGRDYALRSLKDNIINLTLAPGSLVSENELSAELGLSRTPVREALIDLSKVKIITVTPQKKSVISYIDYSLVEEARFMRNVLECAVIDLVCRQRSQEDLQALQENVLLQRFHLSNNRWDAMLALDNQFHQMLFRIAHKTLSYQMIQTMAIHFDRVRSMSLNTVRDPKIVQDHELLLESIRHGDIDSAKGLMDRHLNRYKCDEQAIRAAYPQFFLS